MRKYLLSMACLCSVLTACSQDECSIREMAHCSEDGHAILICQNGLWQPTVCSENYSCGYMDGALQCLNHVTGRCNGEVTCSGNILQKCGEDGFWHYETCPTGSECQNNACTPIQVSPDDDVYGIEKRQCSADKKSIETVDTKGVVTSSKTCLAEVGLDTVCESFGNGHVGCVMPETCTSDFPVSGRCIDNRLMWCDEQYITPKPKVDDCSATGRVCAAVGGKSECRETCQTAGELSCSDHDGIGYVKKCVASEKQNVVQEAYSLCENETTVLNCTDGEIVRSKCGEGEKCLDSQNDCVETCTASEVGTFKCSVSGNVVECSKVEEGYAYISRGRRHCDGDVNIVCSLDEETGEVSEKRINCAEYVNDDGSITVGKCLTAYNYYEDMDVCMADEGGESCGNVDDSGICEGSVLKYCDTQMGYLYTSDCANNEYGYTNCSVYADYADCRASCSKAGTAKCTYSTNTEAYYLTLCAPDDKSGKNVEIEGESICLGDVLYACDESGKSVTVNCALNGGRCDANECVYPTCTNVEPICLADNAMISCEVLASGTIMGSAIQSMTCRPDGTCYVCRNGKAEVSK